MPHPACEFPQGVSSWQIDRRRWQRHDNRPCQNKSRQGRALSHHHRHQHQMNDKNHVRKVLCYTFIFCSEECQDESNVEQWERSLRFFGAPLWLIAAVVFKVPTWLVVVACYTMSPDRREAFRPKRLWLIRNRSCFFQFWNTEIQDEYTKKYKKCKRHTARLQNTKSLRLIRNCSRFYSWQSAS